MKSRIDEIKDLMSGMDEVKDGWSQGWMKSRMDEDKDGWRQGCSQI